MGDKKTIIVWKADRTILNSAFDFPIDRTITSFPAQDTTHKSRIAPRSKMTLLDGELTLIFDDNKLSVRQSGNQRLNIVTVVYYLIYKTFLCYNCLTPEEESAETTPESDEIAFRLNRYVKKHVARDGDTIAYVDTEPCETILNKKDIEDYLTVFDQTIWYAICYYLLGCETQRYFLIEFYKCLEVIKSHFRNEKTMKEVLKPHGFLEDVYKQVKKLANDRMKPLSIARHAPRKGISVHTIDTKWLFSDPMGRRIFEAGEKACRNIVDAYLRFRRASM